MTPTKKPATFRWMPTTLWELIGVLSVAGGIGGWCLAQYNSYQTTIDTINSHGTQITAIVKKVDSLGDSMARLEGIAKTTLVEARANATPNAPAPTANGP